MLQADGGTRCAAICGAYVAAHRALDRFGLSKALPGSIAAVSVGVVEGVPLLDLDYSEDSIADVDVNVVMTGDGRLVEVQATAEKVPFDRARLDELLDLAQAGIEELALHQQEAIAARSSLLAERAGARAALLAERSQARRARAALPGWEIELLDAADYPPEDGETYEANARGKALHGRLVGPADEWMLGEDSGIECDALGGAPGLQSARWAPAATQAAALVARLAGEPNRRARMVAALVAVAPDGARSSESGPGRAVALEPRGEGGFGYDPVFVPAGEERTVAELGDDWKRANSHRARAAAAVLAALS